MRASVRDRFNLLQNREWNLILFSSWMGDLSMRRGPPTASDVWLVTRQLLHRQALVGRGR